MSLSLSLSSECKIERGRRFRKGAHSLGKVGSWDLRSPTRPCRANFAPELGCSYKTWKEENIWRQQKVEVDPRKTFILPKFWMSLRLSTKFASRNSSLERVQILLKKLSSTSILRNCCHNFAKYIAPQRNNIIIVKLFISQ